MTTTTTLATVETALAGIGRAAIERARQGKEFAIHARLRAHADELCAQVADLITRKPDPATWTPDEHATFIRAAEAPTRFDLGPQAGANIRTDEPAPKTATPDKPVLPVRRRIDDEIPF